MRMVGRGALVVVEGLDRSGKSTQCRNLVKRLAEQGHRTKFLCFPDRSTKIGKMINDYLKDCDNKLNDHVVHLLFSANRWEKHDEMMKDLESGITLIVDRYAYSGVAYTSSKEELASEFDWCKQPDCGLPRPDVVLFFQVSEEVANQRSEFGNERYEKSDFQRRVGDNFRKLYDEEYWRTVNADEDEETVYQKVEPLVKSVMEEAKNQPIHKLWQPKKDA